MPRPISHQMGTGGPVTASVGAGADAPTPAELADVVADETDAADGAAPVAGAVTGPPETAEAGASTSNGVENACEPLVNAAL